MTLSFRIAFPSISQESRNPMSRGFAGDEISPRRGLPRVGGVPESTKERTFEPADPRSSEIREVEDSRPAMMTSPLRPCPMSRVEVERQISASSAHKTFFDPLLWSSSSIESGTLRLPHKTSCARSRNSRSSRQGGSSAQSFEGQDFDRSICVTGEEHVNSSLQKRWPQHSGILDVP